MAAAATTAAATATTTALIRGQIFVGRHAAEFEGLADVLGNLLFRLLHLLLGADELLRERVGHEFLLEALEVGNFGLGDLVAHVRLFVQHVLQIAEPLVLRPGLVVAQKHQDRLLHLHVAGLLDDGLAEFADFLKDGGITGLKLYGAHKKKSPYLRHYTIRVFFFQMKADPDQLPYLLRLLDDPSPVVQTAVSRQLREFGGRLSPLLQALPERPSREVFERIDDLLDADRRATLRVTWARWQEAGERHDRLERGLALLGNHIGQRDDPLELSARLDALASAYRETHLADDPMDLARFLFVERGLSGARIDYFSARHSDLVGVLQTGQGLPISLACILMLVGRRLGLPIEGCNYPGHFLARVDRLGETYLIDGYDRGRFLTVDELLSHSPSAPPNLRTLILTPATTTDIVSRVLRNLAQSYTRTGEPERAAFMAELLAATA